MTEVLTLLQQLLGNCRGDGLYPEKQNFEGTFSIPPVSNFGAQLTFPATGINGEKYRVENSLIGKDFQGNACMVFFGNNHPAAIPHNLKKIEETSAERPGAIMKLENKLLNG